ncbi:Magnesium transporter MRS2-4 [Forsythia ovata]|uniref:Magnesium transporter n=1 Tax=Forsythia ovata TaxID=205694 RepID=A0ABD1RI54_9LAMI
MGNRKGQLTFRRKKKAMTPPTPLAIEVVNNSMVAAATTSKAVVGKKKAGGARLWMRLDRWGQSELIECDKSVILKRVSIPSRDLRILGPIFSHSSSILDQMITQDDGMQSPTAGQWLPVPEAAEGLQAELPFEFQVLEIALEVVCTYLDSSVAELERDAYPVLDELAINVSTKNLERVRSLKSNLTRLLAQVQKVRDEIEHLLDDDEDMAQLYLTRKWIQNQQSEALMGAMASNGMVPAAPHLRRLSSTRSGSLVSNYINDHDVEDLEMLLEAYFMQLDGTRNKILSVREYTDDTEDYVNIQLDNQRNELIQLQLTLTIASFAVAVETMMAGWFGMNIPCTLYKVNGIFGLSVGIMTAAAVSLFLLVQGYARWKKLLGS